MENNLNDLLKDIDILISKNKLNVAAKALSETLEALFKTFKAEGSKGKVKILDETLNKAEAIEVAIGRIQSALVSINPNKRTFDAVSSKLDSMLDTAIKLKLTLGGTLIGKEALISAEKAAKEYANITALMEKRRSLQMEDLKSRKSMTGFVEFSSYFDGKEDRLMEVQTLISAYAKAGEDLYQTASRLTTGLRGADFGNEQLMAAVRASAEYLANLREFSSAMGKEGDIGSNYPGIAQATEAIKNSYKAMHDLQLQLDAIAEKYPKIKELFDMGTMHPDDFAEGAGDKPVAQVQEITEKVEGLRKAWDTQNTSIEEARQQVDEYTKQLAEAKESFDKKVQNKDDFGDFMPSYSDPEWVERNNKYIEHQVSLLRARMVLMLRERELKVAAQEAEASTATAEKERLSLLDKAVEAATLIKNSGDEELLALREKLRILHETPEDEEVDWREATRQSVEFVEAIKRKQQEQLQSLELHKQEIALMEKAKNLAVDAAKRELGTGGTTQAAAEHLIDKGKLPTDETMIKVLTDETAKVQELRAAIELLKLARESSSQATIGDAQAMAELQQVLTDKLKSVNEANKTFEAFTPTAKAMSEAIGGVMKDIENNAITSGAAVRQYKELYNTVVNSVNVGPVRQQLMSELAELKTAITSLDKAPKAVPEMYDSFRDVAKALESLRSHLTSMPEWIMSGEVDEEMTKIKKSFGNLTLTERGEAEAMLNLLQQQIKELTTVEEIKGRIAELAATKPEEYDAESAEKYAKALDDVDKALGKLSEGQDREGLSELVEELREGAKAAGVFGYTTKEEVRDAIKKLRKDIKEGTKTVEEHRDEWEKIKKSLDGMPSKVQNSLSKPLKKVAIDMDNMTQQTTAKLTGLARVFETTGARIGYYLTSGYMLVKGVKAIVGAFQEGVKYAMEYEKGLANLRAIINPTAADFGQLEYAIRKATLGTTRSLADVADAATAIGKLGFTARQITGMIEPITAFTQATNESSEAIAELLGSTLKVFDLSFDRSSEVMDYFAESMNRTAISFKFLQTSMKIVGPVAKSVNLSLQDTLGYLGLLANAGLDASRGATAFRNVLMHMANPASSMAKTLGYTVKTAEDVKKAFSDLTSKSYDLGQMLELTDKRSAAAFARMMAAPKELEVITKQINNASGAVQRMREEQMSNTLTSWEALKYATKNYFSLFVDTSSISRWFTKLRKELDATSALLMFVTGQDPTSKHFGLQGMFPGTQKPKVKPKYNWWVRLQLLGPAWAKNLWDPDASRVANQTILNMMEGNPEYDVAAYGKKYRSEKWGSGVDKLTSFSNRVRTANFDLDKEFQEAFGKTLDSYLAGTKEWKASAPYAKGNERNAVRLDAAKAIFAREHLASAEKDLKRDEAFLTVLAKAYIHDFSNPKDADKRKLLEQKVNSGDMEQIISVALMGLEDGGTTKQKREAAEAIQRRVQILEGISDMSGMLELDLREEGKTTGPTGEVDKWAKFMEKVRKEELEATNRQKVELLKAESSYWEQVAKDTNRSLEVRTEASTKWFGKEIEHLAAANKLAQVSKKEQVRLEYMAAKGKTSMSEKELEAFAEWYDKNYTSTIKAIDSQYALQYSELYQNVLKTRVDAIQLVHRKEDELRRRNFEEEMRNLDRIDKRREKLDEAKLASAIDEKKSGLGFLFFTAAEQTSMEHAAKVASLEASIAAEKEKQNRYTLEADLLSRVYAERLAKRIMTEEELAKVLDEVNKAKDKGLITETVATGLAESLTTAATSGTANLEDMNKAVEGYVLIAQEAGEATEELQLLLKTLPAKKFYGAWGQEVSESFSKSYQKFEKVTGIVLDYGKAWADVMISRTELELQDLDTVHSKAMELMDKRYAAEIEQAKSKQKMLDDSREAGLLSDREAAAQKKIMEEQQRAIEKRQLAEKEAAEQAYNKKKQEVEERAAKWRKATQIADIIRTTALGMINAATIKPAALAPFAIAAVGVLGAAQLAIATAQPIPRYARGVDSHPGGLAVVGDGGKHEVILSPATASTMSLPKGSKVFPDINSFIQGLLVSRGLVEASANLPDEVLHGLTKEGNNSLSSISRGVNAMRANDRYRMQEAIRIRNAYKYL